MHIFRNYPEHTLLEKLDDAIYNYFEKNKAPSTVSSRGPIQSPKYWVYLYDENIAFVTLNKIGFLKYNCKEFYSTATATSEKNIHNKKIQISLHLKGYEHSYHSIYTAFLAGAFNLIYVYHAWLYIIVKMGLFGNKRLSNKLADRYSLLRYMSDYYNSHKEDLDIMLHNKFSISSFIGYILGTKNYFLVYDLKDRVDPYFRALSADNLITLDREDIVITDDFWAEYVRLRPKGFRIEISYNTIKNTIILLAALATIIGTIIAVLMFINAGD